MKARDYQEECWWCRAPAGSREHKYKKSDIVREFGPGPYLGDDTLARVVAGQRPRYVQGPNSKQFQFERTLCERCNNTRSQPFDLAYETFAEFIHRTAQHILAHGCYRWSDIYGNEWPTRLVSMKRYLAKHIACRMAEARLEVDCALIAFLDGSSDEPPCLRLEFEIRADIVAALRSLDDDQINSGALWLGDLNGMKSASTGEVLSLSSFLGFGWLRMNYDYGPGQYAVTNINDDLVRLPRRYNVDPEEMKRKV